MKQPATVNPRPRPEMVEGDEAFDRFKSAVKVALSIPKSALPPSPFGQKKKPVAPKS